MICANRCSQAVSNSNSRLLFPDSLVDAFGLRQGSVVSIIGAGGKTTLMFALAEQARIRHARVLVTTSTKILIPEPSQYDLLDLSGGCFHGIDIQPARIYVAGLPDRMPKKMTGCRNNILFAQKDVFDLLLIEADGAACKSLKGWHSREPVVPDFTSHTIGVLDISTVGQSMTDRLVHRPEIFSNLTGCRRYEKISLQHLHRLLVHPQGLFARAVGKRILFMNKVEKEVDIQNYRGLKDLLPDFIVYGGSLLRGILYE